MKWREPWRHSIKQQGVLPQLWRRLSRGILTWYGIFAALVIVYALTGKISHQDLLGRLVEIAAFAAAMSVVLYLVWYLSPRKVDSGPRGIVVTKASELVLIPWQAIASFQLSRAVFPGTLFLRLHSGEEYTIALACNVRPDEISKEIIEMSGAQV
ncbi:hypothetical protein [Luteimonas sp. A501]